MGSQCQKKRSGFTRINLKLKVFTFSLYISIKFFDSLQCLENYLVSFGKEVRGDELGERDLKKFKNRQSGTKRFIIQI